MWLLQRAALPVYIKLHKTSPRLRPKTSKMGHWRSKMELFMKTVYKNFYSLNVFTKRSHHRCSTGFSSRLCWRLLKSRKSLTVTAQKMKFSIKDFFSKCDQIRRKLRIWSHLLKKSWMENFIFCGVPNACGKLYCEITT